MTIGGPFRAAARHARVRGRRWLPHRADRLPTVVGGLIFLGVFVRYRQNSFLPGYSGYLLDLHAAITGGTANAPDQYRPLMPWAARLLGAVMTLPHAVLTLDGILLVVAVVAVHLLLARYDAAWALPSAGLGFAFWFINTENWHPEIFLLLALVAVGTLLLLEVRPPAWAVLLVGVLMLGARTDYGASFGVALVVVGHHRRSVRESLLGAVLIAGAVAATVGWVLVYPAAHYQVGLVQLEFNVLPHSWLVMATFFGPMLLIPAVLGVRQHRLPPLWPVLVWFLAQATATFVVGRVEETRIFLPFSAVLAVAAVLAHRELRDDRPGPDVGTGDAYLPAEGARPPVTDAQTGSTVGTIIGRRR